MKPTLFQTRTAGANTVFSVCVHDCESETAKVKATIQI